MHALDRRGVPQAEIARAVGCGVGSVNKYLSLPAPSDAAQRAPAKPATPPHDARRAELVQELHAAEAAGDVKATAAAYLALERHDDPELDRHLNDQASIVEALLTLGDRVLLINRPEHFAELAQLAAEDPGLGYEPDDGETPEQFAAFLRDRGEEEKARTVAILSAALEIAKAQDISERWRSL